MYGNQPIGVHGYPIPKLPYLSLEELVSLCGPVNRPALEQILQDHTDLFKRAPGSSRNHHDWHGGYWDHITEVMNLSMVLYSLFNSLRRRPYPAWEALEVAFCHDLEKPWKYDPGAPCPIVVPDFTDKPSRARFRWGILEHYGIRFNVRQVNAMTYAEGELHYSADTRKMWPLGHLVHTADYTSARQFSEYPHKDPGLDGWGAGRVTDPSMASPELPECPTCGMSPVKQGQAMFERRDDHITCLNCGEEVIY